MHVERVALIGGTGPAGRHCAQALIDAGVAVRAVARRETVLRDLARELPIEWRTGDARDLGSLQRAIDGCEVLIDCIGLPAAQMHEHPVTARTIAAAIRSSGANCIQVSSYWSYLPVQRLPIDEDHPRTGGARPVQLRREAEDILLDEGAAVVQLPDFFGPHVHASSLQQPLADAAAGKAMGWIGRPDVARDYLYLPDGMTAVARLLQQCDLASLAGQRLIVAGSGPLTGHRLAEIVSQHLGRTARLRAAGPRLLRFLSLFSASLREFLPMVPYYVEPIAFDASRIESLVGPLEHTPYERSIGTTLDWLKTGKVGSTR